MSKDKSSIISFLRYAISQQESFGLDNITIDLIDQLTGSEFEIICAYLLLHIGFTDVELTKITNDYGVDIIAYKDGYMYAIQCKRHRSSIGNKPIQEVFTGKVHYNCDKTIVMTNSIFTKNAIKLAQDTEVELFDRYSIISILKT